MFDTVKIAKKIRQTRMEKNLTQMNLADVLGVSYQAVSNWERGNSMPDIAKLEDLCNALDITVSELLGMETKGTSVVEKVLQAEPLTPEELVEVAPILPPETMKKQAKWGTKKKWNIATLSELAPFLDSDVLEELVEEMEVESLTRLTCIAPFLSEKTLDKLVRRASADDFDGIGAMAPFLSNTTLDYLVERCEEKPEDRAFFTTLLPFLSGSTLERLARKYADDLEGDMLRILAPFLSEGALDRLVEDKLARNQTENLFQLYPFAGRETLRKLARFQMESGDMEEVKKTALFL